MLVRCDKTIFETPKAILLKFDEEEIWFPKFTKEGEELVTEGDDENTYEMPEWLVVEKGVEGYVE